MLEPLTTTPRHVLAALVLGWALPARAGMPFIRLSEVGEVRVAALGFFIGFFFVLAAAVRGLWAVLRRDLPTLPMPTWRASIALVFVTALGLQLVLAMISGARELMTPGAWQKRGATYVLAGAGTDDEARRRSLGALRDALWLYAAAHDGAPPRHDADPAIAEPLWRSVTGQRFVYVGATKLPGPPTCVVAVEPPAAPRPRFVLRCDGTITTIANDDELQALVRMGAP